MKTAIVTGASRGIGAATALLLAKQGYAVAVNYHMQQDKADAIVKAITRSGGKAIAVQADMGSEADILRLFGTVDKELGPTTALVNNAAINLVHGNGTVEEMTLGVVERVMAVNVTGVFLACREAIKRMKRAGGGGIVNLSSETARFGGNKMTHYAASKAAVSTFTIGLARETAQYNIRVNAVSPGIIDTEAHSTSSPERLAAIKASLPMRRMGTADEVAQAIAWLLSDASSYISGAVIPVTGAR